MKTAILLTHENGKHTGTTSIAEIEKFTGINFLATMKDSKRGDVENAKATGFWPTK